MNIEDNYIINPTLMMGTVKKAENGEIVLNLRGRLGLITIPEKLIMAKLPITLGEQLEFYFSYISVMIDPLDYDVTELTQQQELFPCLIGGTIIHVDDTAVRVQIDQNLGTIYVPRRWVFTNVELREDLKVAFYFSKMIIRNKKSN